MKKQWLIVLSLLALAVGLVWAQTPYDMDTSPSGHLRSGYGTALPTLANIGRNPADGDHFTLLTAGAAANPVDYMYSNTNAAWIPMSPIAGASNMATTLVTNSVDVANSVWGGTSQLIFEGATADAFEAILSTDDVGTDVIYLLNAEAAGTYELLSTGGNDALGAAAATEVPANDYAHVVGSPPQTKVWFRLGPVFSVVAPTAAGDVAACSTTGNPNYMFSGIMPYVMENDMKGTATACAPTYAAAEGARFTTDAADNEGYEIGFGIVAGSPGAYVIGTDPAIYARIRVNQATVAESDDFWFGFREAAAYADADIEDYEELCGIGYGDRADGANYEIRTVTQIANAGIAVTDVSATNGVWADGETHTLEVQISAAGVCTTYEDGVLAAAQPATTFTAADVVIPFFWSRNDNTAGAQQNDVAYFEFGIQ